MTATTAGPARDAYEAADLLAAQGHHVHLVADGASICRTGHCTPENSR